MCYSLVLTPAKRQDSRPLENAAHVVLKPLFWAFPTFISIPVSAVARAMLNKTLTLATEKCETLDNKALHQAASN